MKRAGIGNQYGYFFIVLAAILITTCAKSLPPPGGPIDRTPPQILSSVPALGSVRVATDTKIIVRFSEAIDPRTVEKALFVTPQTDPAPKISLKSSAIEISFPHGLEPGRTYVVTLGTDVKDAHGVNLAQSGTIAFSTGDVIDSGQIAGVVYKDGRPASGISMALFENPPEQAHVPLDSIQPDYLTQSGKGGTYQLDYLPLRTYYLVAFDDRNKNRRIDLGREDIGLPSDMAAISVGRRAMSELDIRLNQQDTGFVELRSVSFTADRLLKVRFSRKMNREQAERLIGSGRLHQATDTATTAAIAAYTGLTAYPTSDYLILPQQLTPNRPWEIRFDLRSLNPVTPDTSRFLTGVFTPTEVADQTPPELLEMYPPDKATAVPADTMLWFRFSEPIDSASFQGAVWIIGAPGESLAVASARGDSFTLVGRPQVVLKDGQAYMILLNGPRVLDRAGNRLSDSMRTFGFTTLNPDTLGQISGDIRFTRDDDTLYPVIVICEPARQGGRREITVPSGRTRFSAELFPGYYTVWAFLDRDRDGVYSQGSVVPFRLSEPFVAPSDTVRVRSRFESTGLMLSF